MRRGWVIRLLGIDFETTGLDTGTDRIIEVGAVIWDTDLGRPLVTINHFVHDVTFPPIAEAASKVNGISAEMLSEFGEIPILVYTNLDHICKKHKVEYLVAHNGENFDKPILMAELSRLGSAPDRFIALRSTPWIDTRTDIPFTVEPSSRRLNHLAADLGFVNPFQHRAVFDVLTMLRVLANYDINAVLEYQKIPFVTMQACVGYEDRQLAKDQRFSWEQIGDKRYPKMWVKRIKANLLDIEKNNCKFPIKEIM